MTKMPKNNNTPVPEEALAPPVHDKVQIISPDDDNNSIIPVPLTKQVIEVVATRKGFYGQERITEGRKFSVASFAALGEWMECTDPETEKRRKQFFKDKKKATK